ncbi:MAG: DUF6268 family outer membrane beta-barrel protein [Vicingaceae bacterium]
MRGIKHGLISFFLILSTPFARGQDFYTIFDADVEYSPGNTYVLEPRNTVTIQENNSNFNLPLQRENGDAFLVGLGVHKLRLLPTFNVSPINTDTVYTSTYQFYRYRIQGGYNKQWNDKVSSVIVLMLRMSSDLEDGIQSDIFQFGGAFLMSEKRTDNFTLKYGIYANTEFFGLFIAPLLGYDWIINDKTRMFGVLPARMTFQRKLSNTFRTGLIFMAPSYSYRLGESTFENAKGETVPTYAQNIKNTLSLYFDTYLTKSIALQLRVGRTVFRRIRLYESDDVNTINVYGIGIGGGRRQPIPVPAFRDFDDGWIVNVSLSYRFNLE